VVWFFLRSRSRLINRRGRVAVDFGLGKATTRKHIRSDLRPRSNAIQGKKRRLTRRAKALRRVWRRCSLLTDPCGYARRSRLASHHELLLRGLLLFMRRLLGQEFIRGACQDPRQYHEAATQAKALLLRHRKHRRKTSLYLADDRIAECRFQNIPGPVAKDHKAARNASRYSI
jgi:hypothetical protein